MYNSIDAGLLRPENHTMVALACLLLFCGAVGKSAQIPLYVWLPDAMEGPTPVSALIHAATMVTAGVYLLARSASLFATVPEVQVIISLIGASTALLAALIALTQNDLKRVLAYSTVSQLGYMFMSMGCVGMIPEKATLNLMKYMPLAAAIFHLFTHAFFKALLFLSSGSVMHAMGDVIDMRRFGGLRKVLPLTHIAFLCGALALAGFPLFSGFWSKDMILESIHEASKGDYPIAYKLVFVMALLTAFLTAFYTFRAYFKTFWGPKVVPPEAGDHAHESPVVMLLPLYVLAFGAVFAGAIVEPLTNHWFSKYLISIHRTMRIQAESSGSHEINWPLIAGSSAIAIGGILLAWLQFRWSLRSVSGVSKSRIPGYYLSLNKFYVDEIYESVFVRPINALAALARGLESLVRDLTQLIAALPGLFARLLQPLQNGLVQFYALSMAMGIAAFLFYLILWVGR